MTMRPVTAFLRALAALAMLLAAVTVIHSRFDTSAEIVLDGAWELHHLVQWGPYKSWSFRYRLNLRGEHGHLRGQGATVAVNGSEPSSGEQTTLQIVDGTRERGQIIAWIFERNGERAGRGAIRWSVANEDRLVGTFATTFYSGASVAHRVSD